MRIVTQAEFVGLIIDSTLNDQVQLGTVLQAALKGTSGFPTCNEAIALTVFSDEFADMKRQARQIARLGRKRLR